MPLSKTNSKAACWKNDLFEMQKVFTANPLSRPRMKIGARGGRYVVIDRKNYSINAIYQKIDGIRKKYTKSKPMPPSGKTAGQTILQSLRALDAGGKTLLKDKKQTSAYQRLCTKLKRLANLFFNRRSLDKRLEKAFNNPQAQSISVKTPIQNAVKEPPKQEQKSVPVTPAPNLTRVESQKLSTDSTCSTESMTDSFDSFESQDSFRTTSSIESLSRQKAFEEQLVEMQTIPPEQFISWINSQNIMATNLFEQITVDQLDAILANINAFSFNKEVFHSCVLVNIYMKCMLANRYEQFKAAMHGLNIENFKICLEKDMFMPTIADFFTSAQVSPLDLSPYRKKLGYATLKGKQEKKD